MFKNKCLIVLRLPELKPNRITNVDVYYVCPTIENTMLSAALLSGNKYLYVFISNLTTICLCYFVYNYQIFCKLDKAKQLRKSKSGKR